MGSRLITGTYKGDMSTRPGMGRSSSPMSNSGELGLGRVTRVVLGEKSCTPEEWDLYQRSQALYGIFYKKFQVGTDGQILETGTERFAYCPSTNLRRIPIKNEIVRLKSDIAPDQAAQNGNLFTQKVYWSEIVPAWNHPHLNMLPDLTKENIEEDSNFVDQGNNVNPLQLCPGDVSLEGRHGESLRFGGTWYEGSPIATKETNGKPYAIIRIGQGADNNGQGDKTIYEDVNADAGSIYFTTDHVIPINQAATKRSAWKDKKLVEAKAYNKPQILLTSDRLWLNGRDDIEMSAKNFIGMTADQVNVDGQSQVSLDATKIYFGNGSQGEKEPVLKGATTTKMMGDLIDQLMDFLYGIVDAGKLGNGDPGAFIGVLQSDAQTLIQTLKTSKSSLPNLHSKKVFTE